MEEVVTSRIVQLDHCVPRVMYFSEEGGEMQIILVNNTDRKVAVKVRCSNNMDYRVSPACTFIEKRKSQPFIIVRTAGRAPTYYTGYNGYNTYASSPYSQYNHYYRQPSYNYNYQRSYQPTYYYSQPQQQYYYSQPQYYQPPRTSGGGLHYDENGNLLLGTKSMGIYILCNGHGCPGRGKK